MKKKVLLYLLCLAGICTAFTGCRKNSEGKNETTIKETTEKVTEKEHPDTNKTNSTEGSYYKPKEFGLMNLNKYDSKWCWARSAESEHFYVFWEKDFGDNPNSTDVPSNLRVDIDDLLKKAEQFYATNVEKLGFYNQENSDNSISQYKMQIYLLYQTEWLATGSGYDNKVGALWVNPSTCKPVGSTIAHEIGHSFQYLIYCNQIADGSEDNSEHGFRYGYPGSNGGNGFWEQTAQWQAMQDYPNELFLDYNMDIWFNNNHRAFENEWMRYQSYWFFYYMTEKHGTDTISNIWKNSIYPEDALSCYMRLYLNNDLNTLYEELYEYASRMATFDLEEIKTYAGDWRKKYNTTFYADEDGYMQVSYSDCPEACGFNVVPITLEEGKRKITADFAGLEPGSPLHGEDAGQYMENEQKAGNTDKYNEADCQPGWRYGFVAYCEDGSRVYGNINSKEKGKAEFEIPENTVELYFVVLGAPKSYCCHSWDEKEITDVQMPYKVKFTFK